MSVYDIPNVRIWVSLKYKRDKLNMPHQQPNSHYYIHIIYKYHGAILEKNIIEQIENKTYFT